ncbi:MAG: hypothetical protein ABSB40_01540 [Nitrososphaeria archaeon]
MENALKNVKGETIDSLIRLYMFMRKLEKEGKNKIWTRLLKNSFAPLLIEKFDYVVGNPPWINWESLPEKYRDDTKRLWDSYGLLEKTEGMGLGKTKRDMSMLFTARCLDRYVKDHGKFAFLIPFTLYKTQAGAGFRRFLANGIDEKERKIPCSVLKIHDLVTLFPFEGAINRTSLIIIEKSGKTEFPIPCIMWSSQNSKGVAQESDLEEVRETIKRYCMILAPIKKGNPETPWMIISEKAYEIAQRIMRPSDYKAHSGIFTGLDAVFWAQIKSENANKLLVENISETAKAKVKKLEHVVEKDLVYPIIRGKDAKMWYYKPKLYILLPTDWKGNTIPISELKARYPGTFSYFKSFYEELIGRKGEPFKTKLVVYQGKSKEIEKIPFYMLFNVGPSLSPYKIVWKHIAGSISGIASFSCSVITPVNDGFLGEKVVALSHGLVMITSKTREEAHYLCGILNSSFARLIVSSYLLEVHITTDVPNVVYIPKFDLNNTLHIDISNLSLKAHELAKISHEGNDPKAKEELEKVEEELDKNVARLYDISSEELKEIKNTLKILQGGETGEDNGIEN